MSNEKPLIDKNGYVIGVNPSSQGYFLKGIKDELKLFGRNTKNYNTLKVLDDAITNGNNTLTFRGVVKSEYKRDASNSVGAVKHNTASQALKVVKTQIQKIKNKKSNSKRIQKMDKLRLKSLDQKKRALMKVIKGDKNNFKHIQYPVTIKFFNVQMSEKEKKGYPILQDWKNKEVFYKKPSVKLNKVQIDCGCRDQMFRFEWYNHTNKALGRIPIKYKRLTGEVGTAGARPSVNELKLMGYCKHIHTFLNHLKELDLITN